MFISHFFDVGKGVESSEFPLCPPKEAISPVQMEPCGGLQVVCGSLCQEGSWEESGSLSLILGFDSSQTLLLGP